MHELLNHFEAAFVGEHTCIQRTITFWRGDPNIYQAPHLAKPNLTHIDTNAGIDTRADAWTLRLDSHRQTWTHTAAPDLKPHIHGHQASTKGRKQTENNSHQPLEHVVFGFICQRMSKSQRQSERSHRVTARAEERTQERRQRAGDACHLRPVPRDFPLSLLRLRTQEMAVC